MPISELPPTPSLSVSMLTPWRKSAFSFYHCPKIALLKVANDTLWAKSQSFLNTGFPAFLGSTLQSMQSFLKLPLSSFYYYYGVSSLGFCASGGPGGLALGCSPIPSLCPSPAPLVPGRTASSSFTHTALSLRALARAVLQTPHVAGSYSGAPFRDTSKGAFVDDSSKNWPLASFL